jgi:acyl-CoA dehydrogenase
MPTHLWMTDELRAFGDSVERFFAEDFQPNRNRWRDEGMIERAFWHKAGALGILGATLPEAYGGLGLSRHFDAVTYLEQAKIGDSGWGFSVHNIAAHYIVAFGTEEQKRHWLPKLASGEMVAAIAMTEPGAGSDLQGIRAPSEGLCVGLL